MTSPVMATEWIVKPGGIGGIGIIQMSMGSGETAVSSLKLNHGGCGGFINRVDEVDETFKCASCPATWNSRYSAELVLARGVVNDRMIQRWAAEWLDIPDSQIEVSIEWT